MANDLVVQLGAKLDQFASDMNQAGDMADSAVSKIEQSFASLNPTAGGFGTFFTAALAGFTGVLAYVVSLNKQLADMQTTAEQVGLTLKDFQGVQFGGQVAGLSTDQINDGLEKSAQLLNDASRNSNSLSKELEANGLSVKNSNGQLITQNQLLKTAAALVSSAANPQDAIKVAQMLGFTKEWVPLLGQGAAAMGTLSDKAQEAGAIIDDDTVKKAADFDREWRASSVAWVQYMKAAIAELLPEVDDFIKRALTLKNGGSGGAEAVVKSAADSVLNAAGINPQGVAFEFPVSDKTKESWTSWAGVVQIVKDALADFGNDPDVQKALQLTSKDGGVADPFNPANFFPSSGPKTFADLQAQRQKASDQAQDDAQDANDAHTKIPSRDTGRDQFQIATDSVTKHIATINADTAAVFQNNAAQASLRAEFQELTAIMRDGGEVTQTQIDAYEKLRQSMTAQQALTAAGITLTKEHSAAFLSTSQNIGTATTAYDAAKLKLTQLNSASSQVGSALSTAFSDAIVEGKSLSDVLTGLLQTLEKAAINSVFTSLFNAPAAGGVSPVLSFLGIGHNAGGTDNWSGGPTWVGENGPEIVNLPRGAQVVPNAVAARQSSGGGTSIVYQIDASGADSGTVARIQSTLAAHAQAIQGQGKAMQSAQRYQSTGVG